MYCPLQHATCAVMVIHFPVPKTRSRQAISSQFTRGTEAQKGEPPEVVLRSPWQSQPWKQMFFLTASLRLSEGDWKETHCWTEGWDAGPTEAKVCTRQQPALHFSAVSSNPFYRQQISLFQAPLPPPSFVGVRLG